MRENPARQTRPANTTRRRDWYGDGRIASDETDAFGRWIHDTVNVFTDISAASLPILYYLLLSEDVRFFGVKTAAFAAWMTMTLVATAIRGGWFRPPGTDVLGWVAVTKSLVVLRVLYYNSALALAAYGSVEILEATGSAYLSLGFAFAWGGLSMLVFPRLAERWYDYVSA